MYTVLNVVLGPEIMVTMIVNESQKQEVIDFMYDSDYPAVDLIKEVEARFDARAMNPELADPFNWIKAGEPLPATKEEKAIDLMQILQDNQIDDDIIIAQAIWDIFESGEMPYETN